MGSMGELVELVGRWRGQARMSKTQLARAVLVRALRWNACIWYCLWEDTILVSSLKMASSGTHCPNLNLVGPPLELGERGGDIFINFM